MHIYKAYIKTVASERGLSDCFTPRSRIKIFEKELGLKCRNVKNQFRLSVRVAFFCYLFLSRV